MVTRKGWKKICWLTFVNTIPDCLLIKGEISIMKIVRHPNIVRLHEVLSSRTKIYIILEFITGGEVFDKIRIHIEGIKHDQWSRKNYVAVRHSKDEEVNLDDVCAIFNNIELILGITTVCSRINASLRVGDNDQGPLIMNAFEMITLSQGLNLSALFDR
ncbi:Protein kinase domain [Macleaya cordata]|uniref:non-specific serine/threonine protein kinase n=1 Tax=Macleaya cordata TaxID=56857 RepID=A0A200PNT9_MACCD|nr:Protein kinase domain [Macleaya cordata]